MKYSEDLMPHAVSINLTSKGGFGVVAICATKKIAERVEKMFSPASEVLVEMATEEHYKEIQE